MSYSGQPVHGEALFGSAARRDGDGLSDIDYLIVGDDTGALRGRKQWLRRQGISVSDYTWTRLGRLCKKQTMFAVHLKLEARLVVDQSGRLRDLFSSVRKKSCYQTDLKDSMKLFNPIERIPPGENGRIWALDTLAVAFRNSAILTLAEDGECIFSMNLVLQALKKRGRINETQVESLQRLRLWKAGYRRDERSYASQQEFEDALRAVQHALRLDFDVKVQRTFSVEDCKPESSSTSAYAYMRSVEAELISIRKIIDRNPKARPVYFQLLRDVRDPHAYLWTFMHREADVATRLNQLRSFY